MDAPNHLIVEGETPTFIEHIKAGVKALSEDERSVLMFSGGPTRKETALSEARSYANLAAANDYFGLLSPPAVGSPPGGPGPGPPPPAPSHPRVLLEERALDSYQNVLFSIIHFWRSRARAAWPARLTIVSHAFKRRRLTEEHCAAIAFPLGRVGFVGVNPPGLRLVGGELPAEAAAVEAWRRDPHGVGEELAGKRRRRNAWGVGQRLFLSEEERRESGLRTVLVCGGAEEALADGGLRPWSAS